jgi:murein DD-endopeptidase MepM/ murein hydrolase activator NlpD
MAQQRISFSIATHPPIHPPVASPAEPAAPAPAARARNGKSHHGPANGGHTSAKASAKTSAKAAAPAKSPGKSPGKSPAKSKAKTKSKATAKPANGTAHKAKSPAAKSPSVSSLAGRSPLVGRFGRLAGLAAKAKQARQLRRAKAAQAKTEQAKAAQAKAAQAKTEQAKQPAAKQAKAKPGTPKAPAPRRYPAATQALLPARATPPLLPPPHRGFRAGVGHSTGAAAGLAAAFAAVILGIAWLLQTTFDPEGELTPDAASLVARISPAAGARLNETQLRSLSERLADVEHATFRKRYSRNISIGRGDRLLQLLILEGIPRQDAFDAITVLAKVYDLRKLRAGQRVEVINGIVDNVPQSFVGLRFELGNGAREISVLRQGTGPFTATDVKKQLQPELVRGSGQIRTSLYVAGLKAGVPPAVMIQLIQIYSFDVDFQREIRKGDTFRVLFRNYYDEDGKLVRQGDILYAALTLGGRDLELFRFTPRNGHMDYFTSEGHGVRKLLMRTPIDGARLTSRFGRRRHPILGYSKMHTGVDFGAPPGTPIYAAGDGMIVTRVRAGGYGNYIKIHHNAHYDTAYAHMQRFAVGMAAGTRVRQGQVIGYVGSSGRATGPHLHYEVHYNGVPVNPLAIRLPAGRKLAGIDLREFMVRRTLVSNMYLSRATDVRLAKAPPRRTARPSN